jgi:catechol 2,3-dioxygenase-like lactoylglutathione lyase family enzyme
VRRGAALARHDFDIGRLLFEPCREHQIAGRREAWISVPGGTFGDGGKRQTRVHVSLRSKSGWFGNGAATNGTPEMRRAALARLHPGRYARVMKSFFLAAAIALAAPAPASAEPRAFIAVETADIARAELWYRETLLAERVNSFSQPTYEQRILRGDDVIVELIQRIPASPPRAEGLGIAKAGFVVDDLDEAIERWRAQGVELLGRRIHDESLGLDTILLRDPDGNLIQAFGPGAERN